MPKFSYRKFFSSVLPIVQKNQVNGKYLAKKCTIWSQKELEFMQGSQKQSQNKIFSKRLHQTTPMSYKDKSWVKRLQFASYRSQVAESGGNWLKLAKTISQVYKFASFFDAIYIRCLRGSVGQLLPLDPKVRSSNPVNVRFFS